MSVNIHLVMRDGLQNYHLGNYHQTNGQFEILSKDFKRILKGRKELNELYCGMVFKGYIYYGTEEGIYIVR